MILYYLLVFSLPLAGHDLVTRVVMGMTTVKWLGLACLLVALLHAAARRRLPPLLSSPQGRVFVLFLVVVGLSYAINIGYAGREKISEDVIGIFAAHLMFFVTTLCLVDSLERLRYTLLAAIGGIAFASLYAVREWQVAIALYGSHRPTYIVGDPNYFTGAAIVVIPVALNFALGGGPRLLRLYCGVCLLLTFAAVTLAASRGGFLGLLAALAVLLWQSPRRVRVAVLVVCVLAPLMAIPSSSPVARLMNPAASDVQAADVRPALWKAGFRMMRAFPVFGSGLGTFKPVSAQFADPGEDLNFMAHNSFIEVGAEAGIPGLVLFAALFYFSARNMGRVRQRALRFRHATLFEIALGVQASLIGYGVASLFVSGQYQKMFWFLIFISVCAGNVAASVFRPLWGAAEAAPCRDAGPAVAEAAQFAPAAAAPDMLRARG